MTEPVQNSVRYAIGTADQPWGAAERAQWLAKQIKQRSYQDEVVAKINRLSNRFDVAQYGVVDAASNPLPLLSLKTRRWNPAAPCALITGGVHGYETSGVQGALQFLDSMAQRYEARVNFLVAPCVSPWAYERVQRWNPFAIDPNRSFGANGAAEESLALMRFIAPLSQSIVLHIDLHETTDSDESEFRPAVAARDGKVFHSISIPDGFYIVGDSVNPQISFQSAIIAAVEKVTHIAPADSNGQIIGLTTVSPGVVLLPFKSIGLCAGMTAAKFTSTTEVYPDSARATPAQCNDAQLEAVCAGLDFLLSVEA